MLPTAELAAPIGVSQSSRRYLSNLAHASRPYSSSCSRTYSSKARFSFVRFAAFRPRSLNTSRRIVWLATSNSPARETVTSTRSRQNGRPVNVQSRSDSARTSAAIVLSVLATRVHPNEQTASLAALSRSTRASCSIAIRSTAAGRHGIFIDAAYDTRGLMVARRLGDYSLSPVSGRRAKISASEIEMSNADR